MKAFYAAAAGALIVLAPLAAQAADRPEAPPAQSRAFALGYTLRSCDLRAISFTQTVKRLKDVDDDKAAGAEVAHLSRETPKLRHAQAVGYGQIARLLTRMGGPPDLCDWAARSSAMADAPLAYSEEARTLAKTEPDTATVLAALDESNALKADANARQPTLAAWLKLNGGAVAVWSADVGSYAADLHAATTAGGQNLLPIGTARYLLQKAPPDSPAATREELAMLVPHGGGNLQNLATLPPTGVSADKLNAVFERLLEIYVPRKSAEDRSQVDKSNGV